MFQKTAALGAGIELNSSDMDFFVNAADIVFRPFRIAKECGCKFYLGGDAHTSGIFNNEIKLYFGITLDLSELSEEDKFIIGNT
ncbi:MAG: hypothetical protein IJO74_01220 [Clostridia bacterium]|nr:hypothetical protein [Clostridia bacterium]